MNKLAKIAQESGLPTTQSELLLGIFQEFLGVTAKWEEKAKDIKVTSETQTDMMLLAREGRKEMQQLRLKLDRAHKEQKKIPLLYGRAVDGMKNVLKLPIVELENYLQIQEDFVIIRERKAATARQEQAMRDLEAKEAEEERLLQEQIEKERLEKEKELKEAKEKADIAQKERDEAVAKQKLIDDAAREEREKHQKEIEQKQRENFEREEKIRVENEKKIAAEKEKEEKRRVVGQNRQNQLFEIGVNVEFDRCVDMSDEAWAKLLNDETEIYKSEKRRTALETEKRMESDRKLKEQLEKNRIEQAKILKAKQEKASQVKCPKCSHVFIPPQKLL